MNTKGTSEVKGIVVKLILFALFFIGLDLASRFVLDNLLENQAAGDYHKYNYLFSESDDEVIFLGNSRVENQIVPKVLEQQLNLKIFNAAIGGRDILFANAVLDVMLDRFEPDYIILELQWANLYDPVKEDRMSFLNPYYFKYPELQAWLNQGRIEKHLLYHSALVRYNSTFWELISSNFSDENKHKGYKPLKGNLLNKGIVEHSPSEKVPEVNDEKLSLYKTFVERVTNSKSKLILIVSPNFNPRAKPSDPKIEEFLNFLKQQNVSLIDFGEVEEFANKPELYHDVRHLNQEGAMLFTKALGDSLLSRLQTN